MSLLLIISLSNTSQFIIAFPENALVIISISHLFLVVWAPVYYASVLASEQYNNGSCLSLKQESNPYIVSTEVTYISTIERQAFLLLSALAASCFTHSAFLK